MYNGVLWETLGQALIFVIIITLNFINTLKIINFCQLIFLRYYVLILVNIIIWMSLTQSVTKDPIYTTIDMYKKKYEKVFEDKDENWRKKHNYKNLKDFSYQVN